MIKTLNTTTINKTPAAQAAPTAAEWAEVERLVAAVKAGDKEAWLQLLHLTPPVPTLDPAASIPPPMPREELSREHIYED